MMSRMVKLLTNGDGMQHGLEVGHVIQQSRDKRVELAPLAQQQLGCLHVLFLQVTMLRVRCTPVQVFYRAC